MDDGLTPMPFPDQTPYSNPPRTEEITVAGTSGIVAGVLTGVCIAVVLVGSTSGLPTFFVVVAAIGAGLGLFGVIRSAAESRNWEPLIVHFEQSNLALGSISGVTVSRRSRKPLPDVDYEIIYATLTCTEWVRYKVGTDTRTDTTNVVSEVIPIEGSIQANTFHGTFTMEIPVDRGGPTLDLSDNKVSWMLKVDLDPISAIGAKQDIDLTVSPVLDRRHQRFVDAPPPPGPSDV